MMVGEGRGPSRGAERRGRRTRGPSPPPRPSPSRSSRGAWGQRGAKGVRGGPATGLYGKERGKEEGDLGPPLRPHPLIARGRKSEVGRGISPPPTRVFGYLPIRAWPPPPSPSDIIIPSPPSTCSPIGGLGGITITHTTLGRWTWVPLQTWEGGESGTLCQRGGVGAIRGPTRGPLATGGPWPRPSN